MSETVLAQAWGERLRAAGLRVTQPRVAVLHVVQTQPHIAADQVTAQARAQLGTVSTQAVYDTLNTLTEHGILRRRCGRAGVGRGDLGVGTGGRGIQLGLVHEVEVVQ